MHPHQPPELRWAPCAGGRRHFVWRALRSRAAFSPRRRRRLPTLQVQQTKWQLLLLLWHWLLLLPLPLPPLLLLPLLRHHRRPWPHPRRCVIGLPQVHCAALSRNAVRVRSRRRPWLGSTWLQLPDHRRVEAQHAEQVGGCVRECAQRLWRERGSTASESCAASTVRTRRAEAAAVGCAGEGVRTAATALAGTSASVLLPVDDSGGTGPPAAEPDAALSAR